MPLYDLNATNTLDMSIGPLVMYTILLLICIYSFVVRSRKERTISLYITVVVALLGIIGPALQLVLENTSHRPLPGAMETAQVCELIRIPLIWMAGITLFSAITTKKTLVQVLVGCFFTFVQISLTVVVITFFHASRNVSRGYLHAVNVADKTNTSMVAINWVFFLLFFSLLVQYRKFILRSGIIMLVVFIVLNTLRLIFDTVLTNVEGIFVDYYAFYYYASFFFADFISAISLYIITIGWHQLQSTEYEYNNDFYEYNIE